MILNTISLLYQSFIFKVLSTLIDDIVFDYIHIPMKLFQKANSEAKIKINTLHFCKLNFVPYFNRFNLFAIPFPWKVE